MKMKIEEFRKKHPIFSSVFMLFAGALIGWAATWILPSQDVTVSNIPQKELTCTLDYFYPMVAKKSADANLQLLYDERPVNTPYAYGITITNTGAYAVTNEDFKDAFSIDFSGSSQLVYAQVVKSSNGTIKEEVSSSAKIEGTILSITDFYLNTNESFGIYLIADSKPDTISYHSRISDISRLTLRNTPKEHFDDQIKTVIFLSLIPILFAVGTIIWTSISWRKWRKKEQEFIQKYLEEQQKDE